MQPSRDSWARSSPNRAPASPASPLPGRQPLPSVPAVPVAPRPLQKGGWPQGRGPGPGALTILVSLAHLPRSLLSRSCRAVRAGFTVSWPSPRSRPRCRAPRAACRCPRGGAGMGSSTWPTRACTDAPETPPASAPSSHRQPDPSQGRTLGGRSRCTGSWPPHPRSWSPHPGFVGMSQERKQPVLPARRGRRPPSLYKELMSPERAPWRSAGGREVGND